MNARDLTIKFTSYAHYLSSREWTRERSMLPMLVCVAPDIAQERRMQRTAQGKLAYTPGLLMWTTTEELLHRHGPLAPIWQLVKLQNERLAQESDAKRYGLFDVDSGKNSQGQRVPAASFSS